MKKFLIALIVILLGFGITHAGTVFQVFQGGTGISTVHKGDLIYGNSAQNNTLTTLASGSTGQVLTISGGLPSWQNPSGGNATGLIGVRESGSAFSNVSSLSFTSSAFNVSSAGKIATISLDYINGPASRSIAQTITGQWAFNSAPVGITVAHSASISQNFEVGGYASLSGVLWVDNVTGNVGIGTTNPLTKVQIDGGNLGLRSGNALMLYRPDNGATATILMNSSNEIVFSNGLNFSNQNLNIGSAKIFGSQPILESQTGTGVTLLSGNQGGGAANLVTINNSGAAATSGYLLQMQNASSPKATFDYNGNLGIGTTTPTAQLEIQGTASANYGLFSTSLQVASNATTSYSRFGSSTTTHSNYISAGNDLLISGDLSVIGTGSFKFASASRYFGTAFPAAGCTGSQFLQWATGLFSCGTPSVATSLKVNTLGGTFNTTSSLSFYGSRFTTSFNSPQTIVTLASNGIGFGQLANSSTMDANVAIASAGFNINFGKTDFFNVGNAELGRGFGANSYIFVGLENYYATDVIMASSSDATIQPNLFISGAVSRVNGNDGSRVEIFGGDYGGNFGGGGGGNLQLFGGYGSGSTKFGGDVDLTGGRGNAGASGGYIILRTGPSDVGPPGKIVFSDSVGNTNVTFDVDALKYTFTGKIGVNTTNLPTTLSLLGTASASNLISGGSVQFANNGATVSYSRFGTLTTSHANYISAANDLLVSGDLEVRGSVAFGGRASISNSIFIPNIGGNVGIGTVNPGAVLEVTSSNPTLNIRNSGTNNATLQLGNSSAAGGAILSYTESGTITTLNAQRGGTAANILFQTAGATRANLVQTGFGIGTTNISTKLEVNGTSSSSQEVISNALNAALGGAATVSYSRFGTLTTNHANYITQANDILISGDLEVRGTASFASVASMSSKVFMPKLTASNTGNFVCINTATGEIESGSSSCSVSSLRYKNDVQSLKTGLSEVLALRPVSFFFKQGYGDSGAKEQVGFIAEEAVKVDPRLVGLDKQGRPDNFNYMNFTAILTKAIQDLADKVDSIIHHQSEQDKEIKVLQEQVKTLQQQIKALQHK